MPSQPEVCQGLTCSRGPINISYMRRVSAPKRSTMSSGLTTLYLDLDIFSICVCSGVSVPLAYHVSPRCSAWSGA